jgi:integrase
MRGSIRQRGDAWQLRVFAGRDPVTGRKRWIAKTVHGGKRAVQRELANLIAEVDRGLAAGTDATVNDLIERWLEVVSPDWSPSTLVQTKSAIRTHIEPLLGPIRLKKLKAADLDRFYAELRKRPGRRSPTLAPATIRRVYVIIHAALEQAVKWGWIAVNPADASSPPKTRQPGIAPPSPEAVARLLAMVVAEDRELFTYLSVAVSSGARRSQVCGLQWGDIDLSTGAVKFSRAVVDGPDGISVRGTKTDRVYRVTLDAGTLASLTHHRKAMEERAELCGVDLPGKAFVFSYAPNCATPWRPDGVTSRWTKWRKKAGLDGVRLHDLRHFMATTMLTAGVPVSVVAGRLGHARPATTLNVYSHFVDAGDKVAADVLATIMGEASAAARRDGMP